MKLYEIIETNENHTIAIEWQQLSRYKRSLCTYYKDLFGCEPILMVTSITNNSSYSKIVPSDEFSDAVEYFTQGNEDHAEEINFNSRMLKDL